MSAAAATHYVRRMVEAETRGFGDDNNAMRRLGQRFGISYWTLRYLKHGRAATVDADLYSRLRGAYLSYCEAQIRKLQHELANEKEISGDDFRDLEAEAARLAEKVATAKAARLNKRSG
jgi:hypothetical protein